MDPNNGSSSSSRAEEKGKQQMQIENETTYIPYYNSAPNDIPYDDFSLMLTEDIQPFYHHILTGSSSSDSRLPPVPHQFDRNFIPGDLSDVPEVVEYFGGNESGAIKVSFGQENVNDHQNFPQNPDSSFGQENVNDHQTLPQNPGSSFGQENMNDHQTLPQNPGSSFGQENMNDHQTLPQNPGSSFGQENANDHQTLPQNPGSSFGQGNVNDHQTLESNPGSGFENSGRRPEWPELPFPFICCVCSCQQLREIFHTNGFVILKLEIHGQLKKFSHAISRKYDPEIPSSEKSVEKFDDFSNASNVNVKEFITQYYQQRKEEGYKIIPDLSSDFYEALLAGYEGGDETGSSRPKRSDIANFTENRKRIKGMTLKDFQPYFHLRLEEAADLLKVSTSLIKKKCREEDLFEWPYKKRNDIQNSVNTLREKLSNCNDEDARAKIMRKIAKYEQTLIDNEQEVNLKVEKASMKSEAAKARSTISLQGD